MSDEMITITIDDDEFKVEPGSMLISVTDAKGIHIPRFCYHEKLTIAANCRMCLVEVEKAPKPLPACATPVMDGMKVWTRSEKALAAQKDTMEFLLINHPLDCPICDQGGECELQDLSMGFGGSSSNYQEIKRVVLDKDIGELISTEMTRCIQCTRCVRFGEEIAGVRELGATGRGDRMEIGTFVEKSLTSELSGNIIDICPVGALTAKPSRYTSRSWEMMQVPSIASHDSVGSNINIHTFKQKVVRVVAGDNDTINECWISDRDRFAYQGVDSNDRVRSPMLKQNGIWKEVSWSEALDETAKQIKSFKSDDIGVLASPRATLEELYLLQKLMRAIGVNNIDHRHRQIDFNDQDSMGLFPWLGLAISDIENQNAVLLIGSNVQKEQPMINHRIRKAALKGAQVMSVNTRHLEYNYEVGIQEVSAPFALMNTLATIAKASFTLSKSKAPSNLTELLKGVRVNNNAKLIAQNLFDAKEAILFLGSTVVQHGNYSVIRALSAVIAENTGAKFGYLTESANTAGAWLVGAVPHRKDAGASAEVVGKTTSEMLSARQKAYVLLDIEPDRDCDDPVIAMDAMDAAKCVISISPYASKQILATAKIILPSYAFSETSGTYVNTEGVWQSFRAAAKGFEDSKPAWKILRVLGNTLDVKGFDYVSSSDVVEEIKQACDSVAVVSNNFEVAGEYSLPEVTKEIQRIGEVAEFSGDSLVRRASALQASAPQQDIVFVNSGELTTLGLTDADKVIVKQGDNTTTMSLEGDDSIPDGCALLFAGTESSSSLGSAFGTIEITV